MFLQGNAEDSCASVLLFDLLQGFLHHFLGHINCDWGPLDVVSFLGHCDVKARNIVLLALDKFAVRHCHLDFHHLGAC